MAFHDTPLLASLPLFHNLTSPELIQVAQELEVRSYPSSREIIRLGQHGNEVHLVVSGSVKVFIRRPTGAHVLLAILGRGEALGELSCLDGQPPSAGVVTLEPTCCLEMAKGTFGALAKSMPTLSFNLAQMLGRRLRRVTGQAEALATLDVTGRIARQLLFLADEYGYPVDAGIFIPLHLTQGDLASLVGASREKVNRVLQRFKAHRYIALGPEQCIVLCNVDALNKLGR